MRSRSSRLMAARGSGSRQCGMSALSSSESRPSPTRMPTSAPTTLLVMDQPGKGVVAPNPGAYRSATIRPSRRTTIARVRRSRRGSGSAKADSTTSFSAEDNPRAGPSFSSGVGRARGGPTVQVGRRAPELRLGPACDQRRAQARAMEGRSWPQPEKRDRDRAFHRIDSSVKQTQQPIRFGGDFGSALRIDVSSRAENDRAEHLRLIGGANGRNSPETGKQPGRPGGEREEDRPGHREKG